HDEEGNAPLKPGFRVLATQNPAGYASRPPSSEALNNRFQRIPISNPTLDELYEIADHLLDHPELSRAVAIMFDTLRWYHQMQRWHEINYRLFFQTLAAIKKKEVRNAIAILPYLLRYAEEFTQKDAYQSYELTAIASKVAERLIDPNLITKSKPFILPIEEPDVKPMLLIEDTLQPDAKP